MFFFNKKYLIILYWVDYFWASQFLLINGEGVSYVQSFSSDIDICPEKFKKSVKTLTSLDYFDKVCMSEALLQAKKAFKLDEVPVASVLTFQNQIITQLLWLQSSD